MIARVRRGHRPLGAVWVSDRILVAICSGGCAHPFYLLNDMTNAPASLGHSVCAFLEPAAPLAFGLVTSVAEI